MSLGERGEKNHTRRMQEFFRKCQRWAKLDDTELMKTFWQPIQFDTMHEVPFEGASDELLNLLTLVTFMKPMSDGETVQYSHGNLHVTAKRCDVPPPNYHLGAFVLSRDTEEEFKIDVYSGDSKVRLVLVRRSS